MDAGITNLPLAELESIYDPVRAFTPVRDTVTFPVCASLHESVSFVRISIAPVIPSTNVPESATARIGTFAVRRTVIFTLVVEQLYIFALSHIW